MRAQLDLDVALVPEQALAWPPTVCVVIDQLRASSTLTAALDLGCPEVVVTGSLEEARRLAGERGSLLAGERGGRIVPGFDANNSPAELRAIGVGGRGMVLSTSNGTKVLSRLQTMPAVLIGCFMNARACAEAAVDEAGARHLGIGIVCAGRRGRFALDDALAAGLIVSRVTEAAEARGHSCQLTDAARAAVRLRSAYPDDIAALRESASGRLLISLDAEADIEICASVDSSATVPVLRSGQPLRVETWRP
jgi:2-phosphosulfolactate phosphatase